MKNNAHMKLMKVGPGGRGCPCCFPAPGNRKEEYRRLKRSMKRETRKMIAESIVAGNDNDDRHR